jgi:hypothetical protein
VEGSGYAWLLPSFPLNIFIMKITQKSYTKNILGRLSTYTDIVRIDKEFPIVELKMHQLILSRAIKVKDDELLAKNKKECRCCEKVLDLDKFFLPNNKCKSCLNDIIREKSSDPNSKYSKTVAKYRVNNKESIQVRSKIYRDKNTKRTASNNKRSNLILSNSIVRSRLSKVSHHLNEANPDISFFSQELIDAKRQVILLNRLIQQKIQL